MWYQETGNLGDVVLSSRVRLARNIKSLPFTICATEEQQYKVIELCRDVITGGNSTLKDSIKFIDMDNMKDYEKQALAEKHLISPDMINSNKKRGLFLSNDRKISIMVNEEDHIRIQCMEAGFDLENCLNLANKIDDIIESGLEYGFDEQLGYLTCCPTNIGTGIRASAMVHLPTLVMTGYMDKIIQSLAKLGMTVRGIYGEGSKVMGNIFQVSNQVTLGVSEKETIQKLEKLVLEIVEKERAVRKALYEENKYLIEDKVMRAYGLLTQARILTNQETMSLLSDVRLGINLGLINDISLEKISGLMYKTLPANIVQNYNTLDANERDIKRAEITRENLQKLQ